MATHPFVLLVESDPMLRELIHRELKDEGCIVFDAATLGEALAFAELYPGSIDLAVTDVQTRCPQAEAFTDALRSLPTGAHANVLHVPTMRDYPRDASTASGGPHPPELFDRQALRNAVQLALSTTRFIAARHGSKERAVS